VKLCEIGQKQNNSPDKNIMFSSVIVGFWFYSGNLYWGNIVKGSRQCLVERKLSVIQGVFGLAEFRCTLLHWHFLDIHSCTHSDWLLFLHVHMFIECYYVLNLVITRNNDFQAIRVDCNIWSRMYILYYQNAQQCLTIISNL